jgi:hypothetical protein
MTVTFSVNATANSLAPGTYGPTTITFTNSDTGYGNTTVTATLAAMRVTTQVVGWWSTGGAVAPAGPASPSPAPTAPAPRLLRLQVWSGLVAFP